MVVNSTISGPPKYSQRAKNPTAKAPTAQILLIIRRLLINLIIFCKISSVKFFFRKKKLNNNNLTNQTKSVYKRFYEQKFHKNIRF